MNNESLLNLINISSKLLWVLLMMSSVQYNMDLGTNLLAYKKRISMIDLHCNPTIVINK